MAKTGFSDELAALGSVLGALDALDDTQRTFVLRTAIDRLALKGTITAAAPGVEVGNRGGVGTQAGEVDLAKTTPKDFLKAKKPTTDVQRVACLAYYLARVRQTPQFKTLDLTKLNTEAAGATFSNAAVAVGNATTAGLLAAAGGGKKQITALGDDVIEALPDQENVKLALKNAKKPRKKRAKNKTSKKA